MREDQAAFARRNEPDEASAIASEADEAPIGHAPEPQDSPAAATDADLQALTQQANDAVAKMKTDMAPVLATAATAVQAGAAPADAAAQATSGA